MENKQESITRLDLSRLSFSSLRRIQTLFGVSAISNASKSDIVSTVLHPLTAAVTDTDLVIDKFLKIKKDDSAEDHSIRRSLRQKPRSNLWKANS